jgi:hypothetical protein
MNPVSRFLMTIGLSLVLTVSLLAAIEGASSFVLTARSLRAHTLVVPAKAAPRIFLA